VTWIALALVLGADGGTLRAEPPPETRPAPPPSNLDADDAELLRDLELLENLDAARDLDVLQSLQNAE
jgi:hypothetical protein